MSKIRDNEKKIEDALEKGCDILIKKNKDGSPKIMFYKPRNIERFDDLGEVDGKTDKV